MRNFSILLLAITFLGGCMSHTFIKNDKYSGKSFPDRNLTILPFVYDSLTVVNWDDVVDDFGVDSANSKSFINDTLHESLLKYSEALTRNINITDGKNLIDWNDIKSDTNNYFQISKKINDNYDCEFDIPRKELLEPTGLGNSFVLVFSRVFIARDLGSTGSFPIYTPGQTISTPGGSIQTPGIFTSGGSMGNLGAIVEFIIWDYEQNDYVKCGSVTVKEGISFAMTTGTWTALFEGITKDIYKQTPFEITTANYYQK